MHQINQYQPATFLKTHQRTHIHTIHSHLSIKLINYARIIYSYYVTLGKNSKEESIVNFQVNFVGVIQLCD